MFKRGTNLKMTFFTLIDAKKKKTITIVIFLGGKYAIINMIIKGKDKLGVNPHYVDILIT